MFSELDQYKGAAEQIKLSIQNPNDQAIKDAAWQALLPLVTSLRKFWQFSSALSKAYTDLIKELTSEEGAATQVSHYNSDTAIFNFAIVATRTETGVSPTVR